jgi:hypothetical protein
MKYQGRRGLGGEFANEEQPTVSAHFLGAAQMAARSTKRQTL